MGRPYFEQEIGKDEKVQRTSRVSFPVFSASCDLFGERRQVSHLPDAVNLQGVLLVA
jgi:hypothetical protein